MRTTCLYFLTFNLVNDDYDGRIAQKEPLNTGALKARIILEIEAATFKR